MQSKKCENFTFLGILMGNNIRKIVLVMGDHYEISKILNISYCIHNSVKNEDRMLIFVA